MRVGFERVKGEMNYPFRIERPAEIRADALAGAGGTPDAQAYMDRLIKLVPAEIIGIYLTVRGFWLAGPTPASATTGVPSTAGAGPAFLNWWPLVCVFLLVLTRTWGTRNSSGSWRTIQPIPVILATVSFLVWVYAIGDAMFGLKPDPRLVSTAVVLWVFLVPVFYKGSE